MLIGLTKLSRFKVFFIVLWLKNRGNIYNLEDEEG